MPNSCPVLFHQLIYQLLPNNCNWNYFLRNSLGWFWICFWVFWFFFQESFKISKYFCVISPASSILSIPSFIDIQPLILINIPFLLYIPCCLLRTNTIIALPHSLHALDMGVSYKSLIVFACFFKNCYCEVSEKGQGDYLVGKIESAGTLLLSSKKSDLFMT